VVCASRASGRQRGLDLMSSCLPWLTWADIKSTKSEGTPNRLSLQPLFQATSYNPLTLLNATAQVAMSHHLDDELSKQLSVAANTLVARQAPATLPLSEERLMTLMAHTVTQTVTPRRRTGRSRRAGP